MPLLYLNLGLQYVMRCKIYQIHRLKKLLNYIPIMFFSLVLEFMRGIQVVLWIYLLKHSKREIMEYQVVKICL